MFLGIDDNRLLHMREVGRLCYQLAADLFKWEESTCRQMFLMGFLHDVGYEFASNQSDHEFIGGELLAETNYTHSEPIRLHGNPNADLTDDRLFLLNLADMVVSGDGERIGFTRRLQGIADRYGSESEQYDRALRVINGLRDELTRRGMADLPVLEVD